MPLRDRKQESHAGAHWRADKDVAAQGSLAGSRRPGAQQCAGVGHGKPLKILRRAELEVSTHVHLNCWANFKTRPRGPTESIPPECISVCRLLTVNRSQVALTGTHVQVAERIGKGAYGGVWKAKLLAKEASGGEGDCVVKVVYPDPDLDPEEFAKKKPSEEKLESFQREIEVMSILGEFEWNGAGVTWKVVSPWVRRLAHHLVLSPHTEGSL